MFEKVLAVAGLTAVAGFGFAFAVGGCSSSETPVTEAPNDAGTAKDAKVTTPPPAGEDPPEEACGPVGDPLTIAALDAELGWKPPAARQNACSESDLKKIESVKSATKYAQFVEGTSAACQACAMSAKDSQNWGPIVTHDAFPIGLANFGACFAAVDNPACGKAMQYLQICIQRTCAPCASSAEDSQACVQKTVTAQCEAVFAEAQSNCTNREADATCNSILSGIEYLCAYRDADPDAGAPDGG